MMSDDEGPEAQNLSNTPSSMVWPGRSELITFPFIILESPTA